MLGILLFDRKNELVHWNGTKSFREKLRGLNERLKSANPDSFPCSSSGIFSEISENNDIISDPETINKLSCQQKMDKFSIAYLFLPILSIYRANEEIFDDSYEYIQMLGIKFSFKTLEDSSTILVIANRNINARRIIQNFTELIAHNYGPLLRFAGENLNFLKNPRERIDRGINELINITSLDNYEILNHKNIFGDRWNEVKFMLMKIANGIQSYAGYDRFLIYIDGKLLNHSSKSNTLLIQMQKAYFQCLHRIWSSNKDDNYFFFDQIWLNAANNSSWDLTNLYGITLKENLVILFSERADFALLISDLEELRQKLTVESLYNTDRQQIRDLGKMLEKICKGLHRFQRQEKFPDTSQLNNYTSFLRNIPRTTEFLQGQWKKIVECMNMQYKLSQEGNQDKNGVIFHSYQLSKANSESSVAMQSSSYIQSGDSFQVRTLRLRNVLMLIILELSRESHQIGSQYRLKGFEQKCEVILAQCINFKDELRSIFLDYEQRRTPIESMIHPAKLGYDMRYYVYFDQLNDKKICYLPECLKHEKLPIFECFNELSTKEVFSMFIKIHSATEDSKLLIVGLMKNCKELSSKSKVAEESSKFWNEAPICVAIFDDVVNRSLAFRQTSDLSISLNSIAGSIDFNDIHVITKSTLAECCKIERLQSCTIN